MNVPSAGDWESSSLPANATAASKRTATLAMERAEPARRSTPSSLAKPNYAAKPTSRTSSFVPEPDPQSEFNLRDEERLWPLKHLEACPLCHFNPLLNRGIFKVKGVCSVPYYVACQKSNCPNRLQPFPGPDVSRWPTTSHEAVRIWTAYARLARDDR